MSTEAKASLERHYRRALQRALDAFAQFSDEDWSTSGRRGTWNAQDYLAHLVASQEHEANVVIEQALAGKQPELEHFETPQEINAYNARIIETVRQLSPRELLERFRVAFEANLSQLEGLSDEDLAGAVAHPGWFRPGTLGQVFHTGYLHIPLHYQDIRACVKASKQLPHWMEAATAEEVHDVLSRTFDYMPMTYWPERGGDLKAAIVFNMTGEGGGEWTIEIDGPDCRSYEGRPERANMEMSASPADWVDMTTKQLNPIWGLISRRIRVTGNILLSLKLEKLFEVT
jgi:hypothetical protein